MKTKFLIACVAGAGGVALAQVQAPVPSAKGEIADKGRPAVHEGIRGATTVDNWKVKPNELKIDTVKGRPAVEATNAGAVQRDAFKDGRAVAPATVQPGGKTPQPVAPATR